MNQKTMSADGKGGQAGGDITPLRIGVAGLGTVGAGLVKLLRANESIVADRAGRPIVVTAVA
ncbi:homoserine dehydrogenase, partial [Nguyenibacter vanlangensis]|nr:homoserine dehydrogenase [Nguyenibacter vanlangensis]